MYKRIQFTHIKVAIPGVSNKKKCFISSLWTYAEAKYQNSIINWIFHWYNMLLVSYLSSNSIFDRINIEATKKTRDFIWILKSSYKYFFQLTKNSCKKMKGNLCQKLASISRMKLTFKLRYCIYHWKHCFHRYHVIGWYTHTVWIITLAQFC